VILVNAVFAFVQEYRAEQAVEALRRMLPVEVRVRRDGMPVSISSEDVVPGDLLLLAPGDKLAADAELVSMHDLRVDEATLTGEAYPVEPAERVFAGTYVTAGSGEAVEGNLGQARQSGGFLLVPETTLLCEDDERPFCRVAEDRPTVLGLHQPRVVAEEAGPKELSEESLSSERKRMTTVHLCSGDQVAYVKGAP
jgi:magnesium-transporting ATPase (P-type)